MSVFKLKHCLIELHNASSTTFNLKVVEVITSDSKVAKPYNSNLTSQVDDAYYFLFLGIIYQEIVFYRL